MFHLGTYPNLARAQAHGAVNHIQGAGKGGNADKKENEDSVHTLFIGFSNYVLNPTISSTFSFTV